MTRGEAEARCAELNASGSAHWMVREADGGAWEVVSVKVPGLSERGPLKEITEARPRPPTADDPRPSSVQNVPPYGPV